MHHVYIYIYEILGVGFTDAFHLYEHSVKWSNSFSQHSQLVTTCNFARKRNTTKMFTPSKTQQKLGGGNSNIFGIFTPTPWGGDPVFMIICFRWVEINQKTNGESFVSNKYLKLLSLIGVGREPLGIISGCYMCDVMLFSYGRDGYQSHYVGICVYTVCVYIYIYTPIIRIYNLYIYIYIY